MRLLCFLTVCLPWSGLAVPPDHAEKMTAGLALFDAEVRTLLTEHCLECHGGQKVKGDFDLSTREDALRPAQHGVAIRPFDPAGSPLLALLHHTAEPAMPDDRPPLPAPAITAIARWIELGAPYSEPLVAGRKPSRDKSRVSEADKQWWAFRPLAAPAEGGVDVLLRRAAAPRGLDFAPPADRRTWLRRVTLDLTGLPPTPEEMAAFLADPRPEAFETVVDRLLASPRHGERWARHWLDVARFAESSGFEHDYDRPGAYHYRDFVIRAFNDDLPWDTFLRWQIAGDEHAPDNPWALAATGFLGAGVYPTQITANEVERTRYDALDDMLATTGSAFLGLTIGCARCHDHKFDPIPARDYYRMLSVFTTTVRSVVDLELDSERGRRERAAWAARLAELEQAQAAGEAARAAAFADWLASRPAPPADSPWRIETPESLVSQAGATFRDLGDGSFLAEGAKGREDFYEVLLAPAPGRLTGLKLEALAHPSLTKGGPGRAGNGNFALSRLRVFVRGEGNEREVPLAKAEASFQQNTGSLSVAAALDDQPKTGWAVDPQFGRDHAAVFTFGNPLDLAAGERLRLRLEFQVNTQHHIGRPRFALTSEPTPALPGGALSAEVLAAFSRLAAGEALTEPGRAALFAWWKNRDPEAARSAQALADHRRAEPKTTTPVLICAEGHKPLRHHSQGADFQKETYFLKRGSTDLKDGIATPSYLQVLMPDADAAVRWAWTPPAGAKYRGHRRGLANWLLDVEHGAGALVARVAVNRLWQHHFGRGLVATPDDFGATGAAPSHPELLDWLAAELIRGGWRLKPLHRLLVLSAAYRASSAAPDALREADPGNSLFLRFAPRRLEGEALRDALLAVSGALDETMYGPGTRDERSRRRSVYFTVKRSQLLGSMVAFDAPEPLVSQGVRPVTTVAPQALYLLNSAAAREWSTAFADRLHREAPDTPVERAYALALGREPSAGERADAADFLAAQTASYRADAKPDADRLALVDFCQVLLGLNEFAYLP
jgi:hypothetical protein